VGSNQDRVIRFAVGSPDTRCSGVYRVWGADGAKSSTRPSDLYLSARALGGVLKTSMHESDEWRTAYTEEAVESGKVALQPGQDRKLIGWPRPPQWRPGVTWAHCIMFPSSELRAGVADDPKIVKGVTWIPDPGPGRIIQVDVLLAEPSIGQLNVHAPVDQDLVFLDQFRLPNGNGVLVLRRTVEETPQMVAELQATKQRLAAEAAASGADLSRSALRSLVVVQRDNGLMGIVDAAVAGR
jgi:hypothetical protein